MYLAPGSYVHGGFITTGHQPIKIHGRGILSGEKYKLDDSRFSYAIVPMDKGSYHLEEGLVIVDPPGFFIRVLTGDHNTVRNVKTVGAWTYNTDGVSVGNNGLVEDSFFMVNDDAIKINNKSNTTDATSGVRTAYPSGTPKFTPVFFSGVRVVWSFFKFSLYCVVGRCLSLGPHSFEHCIVCHS